MNLWVRTIRQLTLLAVALFFFSCEDESSILGFKNPNKKFKVNYVDIPLESSVFLMDSLRTSNNYGSQSETKRLLVGKYTDTEFGEISATAFSQFFTTSGIVLKETAALDSVSIRLAFDLYSYGSKAVTPQTISVHELEKELRIDSIGYYFNRSNAPYNASALGTKTFSVNPEHFADYLEDNPDTTVTVTIPLSLDFGQRIFESALRYRNATSVADSTFVKYSEFVKEFKGLAIVADNADKIVGFNPSSTSSRLILHYHDAETDSLQLTLSFSQVVNYNHITADRASTELAGMTQYSQPFTPDNNLRYVQAGTGVLTRLDLNRFYQFLDADSNATMVVNEAELYLGDPVASSYAPVAALSLRAVDEGGFLRRISNMADSISLGRYAGQLTITDGGMFTPVMLDGAGRSTIFVVSKARDRTYYSGHLTLFAQQLVKNEPEKERFRYFALYPESPPIGKSVNRILFNADNIKLRVFYTRPNEAAP